MIWMLDFFFFLCVFFFHFDYMILCLSHFDSFCVLCFSLTHSLEYYNTHPLHASLLFSTAGFVFLGVLDYFWVVRLTNGLRLGVCFWAILMASWCSVLGCPFSGLICGCSYRRWRLKKIGRKKKISDIYKEIIRKKYLNDCKVKILSLLRKGNK